MSMTIRLKKTQFQTVLNKCFQKGGLNMKKWASNGEDLNERIEESLLKLNPSRELNLAQEFTNVNTDVVEELRSGIL